MSSVINSGCLQPDIAKGCESVDGIGLSLTAWTDTVYAMSTDRGCTGFLA
jgi:hypothetical protein